MHFNKNQKTNEKDKTDLRKACTVIQFVFARRNYAFTTSFGNLKLQINEQI